MQKIETRISGGAVCSAYRRPTFPSPPDAMMSGRTSARLCDHLQMSNTKETVLPPTVTHRMTDLQVGLPRLGRTSTTSATTSLSNGPLRLSVRFPDGARQGATGVTNGSARRLATYTRSLSTDLPSPTKGLKHVTFNLDGAAANGGIHDTSTVYANSSARLASVTQVAGVQSWLKTRRSGITSCALPSSYSLYISSPSTYYNGTSENVHGILRERSLRTYTKSSTCTVHDTAQYKRGTLVSTLPSQSKTDPSATTVTSSPDCAPGGSAVGGDLIRACTDGDEAALREIMKKSSLVGISSEDVNCCDNTGRTSVSYLCANGQLPMLELLTQVPGVDVNKGDNEGNTPLHFASQAGHAEILNFLLSRCSGVDIDARNNLGFTPLMKAAVQGRTKCAKLLLFAGAAPQLRDYGRGFRAEQWARYCGRIVCAEVIDKFSRNKVIEREPDHARWGSEPELGDLSKLVSQQSDVNSKRQQQGSWLRSKLRRAFKSNDPPKHERHFSLVTQLTSAAICASSPVLQSTVPPTPNGGKAASQLEPGFVVPKLQITPAVELATTLVTGSAETSSPNLKDRPSTARHSGSHRKKK